MRDFNFFEAYGRKKSTFNLNSPFFLASVLVGLAIIFTILLFGRNMLLIEDIKDVRGQIDTLSSNPLYEEALAVKDRIDGLNQYDSQASAVLEQFLDENIITTRFFDDLLLEIPSAVVLTEFNIDNSVAIMNVQARNRKAVAETVLRLKESGLFKEVTFETIVGQEGSNIVDVVINATMKAGGGR